MLLSAAALASRCCTTAPASRCRPGVVAVRPGTGSGQYMRPDPLGTEPVLQYGAGQCFRCSFSVSFHGCLECPAVAGRAADCSAPAVLAGDAGDDRRDVAAVSPHDPRTRVDDGARRRSDSLVCGLFRRVRRCGASLYAAVSGAPQLRGRLCVYRGCAAGADAVTISGAGPTVIALVELENDVIAKEVGEAMKKGFKSAKVDCDIVICKPSKGPKIVKIVK